MAIMYIVNSVQTIGDLSSTTMAAWTACPPTRSSRAVSSGQGVMSVIGALFGGLPAASYSQNVGIVR